MAHNSNIGSKFTPVEQAILITLLYSDIFSFPLTREELWQFLLTEKSVTKQQFSNGLIALKQEIVFDRGYYCLVGRKAIISKRIKYLPEVIKKTLRAQMVATRLSIIPSILFIGISGGLAAANVSEKDDIDLVIIVKKKTLYITRLLILCMLESMGIRRMRNQKNIADTICVNLLFDETVITWFHDKKDIYIAREIAQIVPLFERQEIFTRFLKANVWLKKFVPNVSYKTPLHTGEHDSFIQKLIGGIFLHPLLEDASRRVQLRFMKQHQTKEVITEHFLAFHPNDYKLQTLNQLRLKMQQLGLLTKP